MTPNPSHPLPSEPELAATREALYEDLIAEIGSMMSVSSWSKVETEARRGAFNDVLAVISDRLAAANPPEPERECCADKGGGYCQDTTGLDHCMDRPEGFPKSLRDLAAKASAAQTREQYETYAAGLVRATLAVPGYEALRTALEAALERERDLRQALLEGSYFHVTHDGKPRHPETCHPCRAIAERSATTETTDHE